MLCTLNLMSTFLLQEEQKYQDIHIMNDVLQFARRSEKLKNMFKKSL